MNDILALVGSLASIGSIPLAVYLYLRTREARDRRLRQDIAQTLSYRIGEGRAISLFEVRAVIESKCRDVRAKPSGVASAAIVEDLVSQTIASPLLDAKRKEEIVENLRAIHGEASLLHAIDLLRITPEQLLAGIEKILPAEQEQLESIRQQIQEQKKEAGERVWSEMPSTLFAVLGAILTLLTTFFSLLPDLPDRIAVLVERADVRVLLGIAVSLLAGVASAAVAGWFGSRQLQRVGRVPPNRPLQPTRAAQPNGKREPESGPRG